MLSIEEKKELDNIKESPTYREVILLRVFEKQQKEIEKLKEKIKNFTIEDEKIFIQFGEIIEKKRWKNKIKAKIEEIKDGTYDAKIILQKLLEEN